MINFLIVKPANFNSPVQKHRSDTILYHWSDVLLQYCDTELSLCTLNKYSLKMRKLVGFFIGFVMISAVSQAQQIKGIIKDQQGK